MSRFHSGFFSFLFISLTTALPALAVDFTWTGSAGADFDTPGNWTPGGGPPDSSTDTATIDNGGTADLGTSNTVLSLTLGGASSGTINLNAGGNLTAGQVLQGGSTGTINFDGGALTALADSADFLSGTTNTIAGGGATIDTQGYNATAASALANAAGATGSLTKEGSGVLTLNTVNSYTGTTTIKDGALQANDYTGLPYGSFLNLDGGVLQGYGATSFIRPLGTSGWAFQWGPGGGGFSAGTGLLTVNILGSPTLVWGDASNPSDIGTKIIGPLKLNSPTSTNVVDLKNNIDLNGQDRVIEVNKNDITSAYKGEISGNIVDSQNSGAGIIKRGPGRLWLDGTNNTYTGTTRVEAGFLAYETPSQPNSDYVVTGGTLCFCSYSPTIKSLTMSDGTTLHGWGVVTCTSDYQIQGAIINGFLAGDVGLVKTGDSVAKLYCANTYTGTTLISGGTLVLAKNNTLPLGEKTGQISTTSPIVNYGTFLIDDDTYTHTVGTISGPGTTRLYPGAQLTATSITQGSLIIGVPPSPGIEGSSPVPEPSTWILLALAGLGVLRAAWRRK
ncbi:MAG: autotransporter-associated beta strand repeat-containing protein [Pirellulales bacterium]|nr:autotransporter-associated beta strand repeat-containing protein [Pirellulales bacterium]